MLSNICTLSLNHEIRVRRPSPAFLPRALERKGQAQSHSPISRFRLLILLSGLLLINSQKVSEPSTSFLLNKVFLDLLTCKSKLWRIRLTSILQDQTWKVKKWKKLKYLRSVSVNLAVCPGVKSNGSSFWILHILNL